IASVISRHRANIISARTETNETGLGLFHFTILVESTEQLRKIMSEIRKVKKVLNVRRIVRIE
ncbi:MAG: ACT domain-containing protein, partial [Proteobacteria bacterium]|nr:ACT domain-containing protein [Pseudomonadota bacterium]